MSSNFSTTAAFIWSVADLLRGDFKQSQYGRIILPFTLLRRLECVLEEKKDSVIAEVDRINAINIPDEAQEKFLLKASGLSFFNKLKNAPQQHYIFPPQNQQFFIFYGWA